MDVPEPVAVVPDVEVPQTPPPVQIVVCPVMPHRRCRVFTENDLEDIRGISRKLNLDNPDS